MTSWLTSCIVEAAGTEGRHETGVVKHCWVLVGRIVEFDLDL